MVTNLKSWLRRQPQPARIRYTTAEDEERELELSSKARNRWSDAAEALEHVGAKCIEALDKDGKVLRVTKRDEDGETTSGADAVEKQKAKETAALALVLDAQGRRISEAFNAGADAASRGQDNLVQVVNILTAQWSATMQSLHNVSMNLAKLARGAGADDEDEGMSQQMQQLLGIAAMKMMGMNGTPSETPPKKEGK